MGTLTVATRHPDFPSALRYGASAIVILSSERKPRACLGVQISSMHVLTMASCAATERPLLNASFVDPEMWNSPKYDLNRTELRLTESRAIRAIEPIRPYRTRKSEAIRDRLHLDLAVVVLSGPIGPNWLRPVTLPLQVMAIPDPAVLYRDDALITVDPTSLTLWVSERVQYMDNPQCGLPVPDKKGSESFSTCILPLLHDDTKRLIVDIRPRWSFLVRQRPRGERDWLLGFGDSSVRYSGLFRAVSWIARVVPDLVADGNYTGLETAPGQ